MVGDITMVTAWESVLLMVLMLEVEYAAGEAIRTAGVLKAMKKFKATEVLKAEEVLKEGEVLKAGEVLEAGRCSNCLRQGRCSRQGRCTNQRWISSKRQYSRPLHTISIISGNEKHIILYIGIKDLY